MSGLEDYFPLKIGDFQGQHVYIPEGKVWTIIFPNLKCGLSMLNFAAVDPTLVAQQLFFQVGAMMAKAQKAAEQVPGVCASQQRLRSSLLLVHDKKLMFYFCRKTTVIFLGLKP